MSDGRVHYARNGDVRLAYRVLGDSGPVTIWIPGWVVSNVDTVDEPDSPYRRIIELLSGATRFVMYDRRGTGLSDPATHVLSMDENIDDLRAVMDAIGADRATLLGSSYGGTVAVLFAATYPDRVRSLTLYATAARYSQELPDHPWGFTQQEVAEQLDEIDRTWGEGALADLYHGEAVDYPGVRELFGRLQRAISSPSTARLWWQAFMEIDVRSVLASVHAPTVVLARPGDLLVPMEAAAALAAAMPNAQLHVLRAGPHNGFDVLDDIFEEIRRYTLHEPSAPVDVRLVKTVVFTDIVNSTRLLSDQGDGHWRRQLDSHDQLVDHVLSRHAGVRAKHTGDGVFALFEAPTRAARCVLELLPALAARGIRIRAGIHTGECERRGDEWSGMAVHIGARLGALAGAGEVLASRTVKDLSAGSGLIFESLGPRSLKGLAEEIDVYRVS